MITLIFPAYNEQENIEELYKRFKNVTASIKGESFEFLFIDDGSYDRTPEILRALYEKDKSVKIIRLARNCGSHAALAAGLHAAKGGAAIVMAADLQDPPELIGRLIAEWQKGPKIVWGARLKREDVSGFFRFFSKLYYWLVNRLTAIKFPPLGADVFLVDRLVMEAFRQVPEKHASIFMVLSWLGFPQATIAYAKEVRFKGKSKWTLQKRLKLAFDSLLSFSDLPAKAMSFLGLVIVVAGLLFSIGAIFNNWAYHEPPEGWFILLTALLLIGGVQLIAMGILAEYIYRTFDEARQRPRYVIEYTLGEKT